MSRGQRPVTLIEAAGHTRGAMAMQADRAETGTMIFTSDAVCLGDAYGPPAIPAAIVSGLSAWYASGEKLRGIAEKSSALVVCGHDAERLWSMRRVWSVRRAPWTASTPEASTPEGGRT